MTIVPYTSKRPQDMISATIRGFKARPAWIPWKPWPAVEEAVIIGASSQGPVRLSEATPFPGSLKRASTT